MLITDSKLTSEEDEIYDFYPYFNLGLGSKGIRFGTWNINRLTTGKFDQIKPYLLGKDNRPQIDVMSLIETLLKPTIPDSVYSVPGFTVYRKDHRGKTKGGGVLIYGNDEVSHHRRTDLEKSNIEIIWIELRPFKSNRPLLFAGFYRPPSYLMEDDERLEKNIETAYLLNMESILAGDISINFLNGSSFQKHCLIWAILSMNFKQLVTWVTRPISGTCIDLVFANFPERIHTITIPNVGLEDHLPVFGVRLYKAKERSHCRVKPFKIVYRNVKRFIESDFLSTLKEIPWDTASDNFECRFTSFICATV